MFVVILTYKKPLADIDQHLAEHRAYLDSGYKNNFFVTSGPKNPRDGGIIISHLKSREQLEKILNEDPFSLHDLADYEIIEFNPIKYHADFLPFIKEKT